MIAKLDTNSTSKGSRHGRGYDRILDGFISTNVIRNYDYQKL